MADPLVNLDLAAAHLYLSVVELGSISKAARRHGLSQPTASQRIARLERQAGLRLLHRSTTGSTITDEGRRIAERWRPLVAQAGEVAVAQRAIRNELRSATTVAVTPGLVQAMLPTIAAAVVADDPAIGVEVLAASSQQACGLVRQGRAELGLVDGPELPLAMHGEVVGRRELVPVVSTSHPWARRRRPITAEELATSQLVMRQRGSGTRDTIEARLAEAGYPLTMPPLTEAVSTNEVISTVAFDQGKVCIVARDAAQSALSARALRIVPSELMFDQQTRLVWLGRAPRSGAAGRFVEAVRSLSP